MQSRSYKIIWFLFEVKTCLSSQKAQRECYCESIFGDWRRQVSRFHPSQTNDKSSRTHSWERIRADPKRARRAAQRTRWEDQEASLGKGRTRIAQAKRGGNGRVASRKEKSQREQEKQQRLHRWATVAEKREGQGRQRHRRGAKAWSWQKGKK